MKKIFALLALAVCGHIASAQSVTEIKPVLDACNALRDAISVGTNESLRNANNTYKGLAIKEFDLLRLTQGEEMSLDGHFVFNPEFIDSLIVNRQTYRFAQRYADRGRERGTSSKGFIATKNCGIKKNSTLKYSLPSRRHQEIAVVTEPGGAVSLKVYDKKSGDMLYRDTQNIRKGEAFRSLAIELPPNKVTALEIEIKNTTDRDISFVIIGN